MEQKYYFLLFVSSELDLVCSSEQHRPDRRRMAGSGANEPKCQRATRYLRKARGRFGGRVFDLFRSSPSDLFKLALKNGVDVDSNKS